MRRFLSICLYLFIVVAMILVAIFALAPGGLVSAQNTRSSDPTATATAAPEPTAIPTKADIARDQFKKVRTNLYGLSDLLSQAAAFRSTYLTFMFSEQFHNRDTSQLQSSLNVFDSFISQAQTTRLTGIDAVGSTNGFDSSGNVTNIDLVEGETQTALSDLLVARNFITSAIDELHSGLNLHQQIWSGVVTVPNIPKLRLGPFTLAAPAPVPLPAFSSLTPRQQARAKRILGKYNNLRAALNDLKGQYDQAAGERLTYQRFFNAEQAHNRNTSNLQSSLNVYDSFAKQGMAALQAGLDTLNDRSGFDSSGDVVLLDAVEGNVNTALGDFLVARGFLAGAVNELHSGLNLYHQISGMTVPDIPKIHLPPFLLTFTSS